MSIAIDIVKDMKEFTTRMTSNRVYEKHVITDSEISEVKLGLVNLKKYVNQYIRKIYDIPIHYPEYVFPMPDNVSLKDPTPLGNLFRDYNWPEVKMNITVLKAELIDIATKNHVLDRKLFDNMQGVKGAKSKFTVTLSQNYENMVKSSWSNTNKETSGVKIYGTFGKKDVASAGVEWNHSYERLWGRDSSTNYKVSIGSAARVNVSLEKGQVAEAMLSATRSTIRLRVYYNGKLDGCVFTSYPIPIDGKYFWCYHIQSVLRTANIKNDFNFSEEIEIGYYFDGKIEVIDRTPNRSEKPLTSMPVSFE